MPSVAPSSFNQRWKRAVENVERWLFDNSPQSRQLNNAELDKYKSRKIRHGWRILSDFEGELIALDVLIPWDFPWKPARVALAELQLTFVWPHVEDDGVLCVYADNVEVAAHDPIGQLKRTLSDAAGLIEKSLTGDQEDFRAEFHPYWSRKITSDTKVFSLVSHNNTSLIKVWFGDRGIILADDEGAIRNWLKNKQGKDTCRTTEDGAVLALPQVLLPSEYPENPSQLLQLARSAGAESILANLVEKAPSSIITLLRMETVNGTAMGAVRILSPEAPRVGKEIITRDYLQRGFRPGNVPRDLLIRRYLSGAKLKRLTVQRTDSSWIHGRDSDPRHFSIQKKRVAILGCGSLGSSIAAQLAAAGVGNFLLVDPEEMAWENVARHHLGANQVNRNKAQALSDTLRNDYPHIQTIDTWSAPWQEIGETDTLLQSCDVIVSAIGHWSAEGPLNEWHLAQGRSQPIIYAWLEAHATAAHSLTILPEGGCFACHLNNHGQPAFQVTNWPHDTTRHEPACGAIFQPYGAIELMDAVTLSSKAVLDVLLGRITSSTARTWVGRIADIKELGGLVSEWWQAEVKTRQDGEFISTWEYKKNSSCPWCGGT